MNLLSMLKKDAFRQSSLPTVAEVATVTVISPWGRESALDASTVNHASTQQPNGVISTAVATVSTVAEVKQPSIKLFETYLSPRNVSCSTGEDCSPPSLATVTVATSATVGAEPLNLTHRLLPTWLARDTQILDAAPVDTRNTDLGCWPHSTAMTGREISTFTALLARITDKGVPPDTTEAWAEKLLQRDRELDDRKACLECSHLGGSRPSSWRCGNWRQAGIALRARDADLPSDLVMQLQRCDGFKPHICSYSVAVTEPCKHQ